MIAVRSRVGLIVIEICRIDVRNLGLWSAPCPARPRVAAFFIIFALLRWHSLVLARLLQTSASGQFECKTCAIVAGRVINGLRR